MNRLGRSVPRLALVALGALSFGCAHPVAGQRSPAGLDGSVDAGAAARLVVEQSNAFRRQQGRRPLRIEPALTRTAEDFARWMAAHDRFGHTADGKQPAERAMAHGYAYCIIAENIGEFRAPGLDTSALAEQLMRGWQRSPEHRENLLDGDVTETGAGVARNHATGSYVAVQLFGLPKSASITFSLANRTDAAVAYTVGGDRFTLPPATIRTHETCGAAQLALDGGPARGRTPVDGEQLAVVRAPDGTLALQPQAR